MDEANIDIREAARARAWSEPLETLSPAQADLFAADALPVIIPQRN